MADPERIYRYQDLRGTYDLTRSQVLAEYFAYWSEEMWKVGKEAQISEDACIEDWVVVHWAMEIGEGG